KLFPDVFPKLVNRELGRVDDEVRHGTDGGELRPLRPDVLQDGLALAQGMRPAGLAKAAENRLLVRVKKDQPGFHAGPDAGIDFWEAFQSRAFADVHYQGRRGNAGVIARQLREFGNQL